MFILLLLKKKYSIKILHYYLIFFSFLTISKAEGLKIFFDCLLKNINSTFSIFFRFSREEGVNYNNLIHFFVAMLVQGLNLCGTIGEGHSYNLLQVVLAGLKNDILKEYRSGVVILFACLVPRVAFNGKVTKKIVKSLNKLEEKDIESLSMLALLFRCQINHVDAQSVLTGFLAHRQVLHDQGTPWFSPQIDLLCNKSKTKNISL